MQTFQPIARYVILFTVGALQILIITKLHFLLLVSIQMSVVQIAIPLVMQVHQPIVTPVIGRIMNLLQILITLLKVSRLIAASAIIQTDGAMRISIIIKRVFL